MKKLAALALLPLLILLPSCDVIQSASQNSNCGLHSDDFRDEIAADGALTEGVSEDPAYPMAIVLSQGALNQLFSAIADAELPVVELAEDLVGIPIAITLSPQLPLIQIGGELDCLECLLTELAFGVTVDVAGEIFDADALGRYQFPLTLQPEGLDSTHVVAQLAQSTLLQLDLSIAGLSDDLMDVVEPVIAMAATEIIQLTIGDTELFELGAWSIGDGDVRMLGRGPIIEPDYGTVVIGVHTNLIRPLSGTVALAPELPEGVDIGLQFHPELLGTMVQRMMFEGHIGRSYDMSGEPDTSGDHQVSLRGMVNAPSDLLTTRFRIWRTSGGFCGLADLQADLGFSISDERASLSLENVQVLDGVGAGELLVAADSWLSSRFISDLIDYSELTLNYREFTLSDDKVAEMTTESVRVDLDGRGLSVFLNIDAIVETIID